LQIARNWVIGMQIKQAACIGGQVIGVESVSRHLLSGADANLFDQHPGAGRLISAVLAKTERAEGC
jgi:carnitine 3-dehydrogenase